MSIANIGSFCESIEITTGNILFFVIPVNLYRDTRHWLSRKLTTILNEQIIKNYLILCYNEHYVLSFLNIVKLSLIALRG
jgi:uncharacterized protein YqhQ